MRFPKVVPWRRYSLTFLIFAALFAVACGASEAPAPAQEPASQPAAPAAAPQEPASAGEPAAEAPAPAVPTDARALTETRQFESTPTPEPGAASATATPVPTPTPGAAFSAKDTIYLVTQEEPTSLGTFSDGCSGNVPSMICEEIATDPFTWIDSTNFEVVPLSGVDSWSQVDPDRWRFNLREGVEFHNGEPWNAEAVAWNLDQNGRPDIGGGFSFHQTITGEVVDDLTVDVVCEKVCPIFPRTAIFTVFQAPEWYQNASEDERERNTIGIGPYKIVEWRPGVEVEIEAYENYKPNTAFDAQAPSIQYAFQIWRPEPLVRAAVIQAGEGDWAVDIGFENIEAVPVAKSGTNNEVFTLVADNIWHPELRKKEVRQALALGVDCQTLMEVLYDGLQECIGNISQWGTVGINESNYADYGFDPDKSRELLAASGYYKPEYDPADNNFDVNEEIRIHTRAARVYRGLEMFESVVSTWRDLGVNAHVVVLEPNRAREARRSGCGKFIVVNDDGSQDRSGALACAEQTPPAPFGASTHYYETATSNEALDMQRQLVLRNSCFNVNSRVCNLVPGIDGQSFEDSIDDAISTPLGPDRVRKMEAMAQIIHDEYWFLPFFVSVQVYGMAANLEWEPRYDPRTRVNSMRFSQ
ncbi:MAG: ABC transporter substrate-binding protein [Chloroflexota bacterium]|nr:ABC transporter substrate-binding protein [Chloroflexota bacterium]